MKQICKSLGRLAVITCISLAIGTIVARKYYQDYWHGTIKRVQTVDFNILAHTLPTKLSYTLINQDLAELQRTINSNYGLFGIVVTDCLSIELECSNQKILYSSDSQHEWKRQLNSDTLLNSPYSVLRNPPPLIAEGGFDSSRDEIWNETAELNEGEIIGRVYYVRGIPQKFWVNFRDWLKKLPYSLVSDSGVNKYYGLTFAIFLAGGVAISAAIELILYRKRVLKSFKNKALLESNRLKQQISALIKQKERILANSEDLQKQTRENAQKLEDEISQIRNKFDNNKQQYEQKLTTEIQNKTKTEEKLQTQKQLILELRQRQQENIQFSEQLQAELTEAQSELEELQQDLSEQTDYLDQLQEEKNSIEVTYLQEISTKKQSLDKLQQKLVAAQAKNQSYQEEIKQLKIELRNEKIDHENDKDFLVMFEEENKKIEIENKKIMQENNDLFEKINQKVSEIESLNSKYQDCHRNYSELQEKNKLYQKPEIKVLDLSSKYLAFIGGDQEIVTRIIEDLRNDFNLKKFVKIPPKWERQIGLSDFKLKVQNNNFLFYFTGKTKHDFQNYLKQIRNDIAGEIKHINTDGYSGALREILEYLATRI